MKSSLFIRFVKSLICDPIFDKKRDRNEIERRVDNVRIRKTLKILDFKYLSNLSTLGKKIVVKRKENISIPIIEAKNGKIFHASQTKISNNINL